MARSAATCLISEFPNEMPASPAWQDRGMGRIGVYPGSFNPPTLAHLAIARAALAAHRLDRVDLSVSRTALAKEHVDHPEFDDRAALYVADDAMVCAGAGAQIGVTIGDRTGRGCRRFRRGQRNVAA